MTNDPSNEGETVDYGDEGARPSSLIPMHKLATPDRLYDLQLMRCMEIANERTLRELGPPPRGGFPVIPKRKPKSWRPDELTVPVNQENVEDETMMLNHLAMAAALSAAVVGSPAAYGSSNDADKVNTSVPNRDTRHAEVVLPEWPNNGIAERELGDGEDTWPENMFVEHANGRWIVWVLMAPERGPAKALDFFSGDVVPAKVKRPGEYNDSFVDPQGVTHRRVIRPSFDYKDPRPGGGLGGIHFYGNTLTFEDRDPCAPFYLNVSRRMADDDQTVIWGKLPLYKTNPSTCSKGVWESYVNTALDLRDGTLLVTGGKYIFRIHQNDMSPVGDAPHLHVVDEADVSEVIEQAKGEDIKNVSSFLTEKLNLH